MTEEKKRVHVIVEGRVQGVFFRAFTRDAAVNLGLSGWVRNRPNGSVEAIVEGSTGTFFDERSNDLSRCIERWFRDKPDREKIRLACYRVIDEKYNPKVQIEVLKKTLGALGLEQKEAPGH